MKNCYDCGNSISSGEIFCPNCGGRHISEDEAFLRPNSLIPKKLEGISPPWPLEGVTLPPGNILFLSGEPGEGKTTLTHYFQPTRLDSTEQKVPIIAHRYKQIHGSDHSPIEIQSTRKPLGPPMGDGTWAIDSISNMENGEEWYHTTFFDWIHCSGEFSKDHGRTRFGIAVAQSTKMGDYRGSSTIPHLADICVHLRREDDMGLSVAEIWKNRYGSATRRYYELGMLLTKPTFEGRFGIVPESPGFKLVPPWVKSKWLPSEDGLDCLALASIPKGRKPAWAKRNPRAPDLMSPAEEFCATHDICFLDADGINRHAKECKFNTENLVSWETNEEQHG